MLCPAKGMFDRVLTFVDSHQLSRGTLGVIGDQPDRAPPRTFGHGDGVGVCDCPLDLIDGRGLGHRIAPRPTAAAHRHRLGSRGGGDRIPARPNGRQGGGVRLLRIGGAGKAWAPQCLAQLGQGGVNNENDGVSVCKICSPSATRA